MPSLGALTLPADPVWTDEPEWCPVQRTLTYGLTGAPIIQEAVKQAGRPITLDCGWLNRTEMLSVMALADLTDTTHTLIIAQGTYSVGFLDPPYTITPLRQVSDPDAAELYAVVLNLMEM